MNDAEMRAKLKEGEARMGDAQIALIVIDMLVDYFEQQPALQARREQLVQSITTLTREFRRFGKPVIWVRQEFKPDLSDSFPEMRRRNISITIEGTPGCQILPELEPDERDFVIVKKRYSAFYGTELDDVLAKLGASVVVLAGVNTHACIRMTAIDAYQRDLEVVLSSDGVASNDAEHERVSLQYMEGKIAQLMSTAELARLLQSSAAY